MSLGATLQSLKVNESSVAHWYIPDDLVLSLSFCIDMSEHKALVAKSLNKNSMHFQIRCNEGELYLRPGKQMILFPVSCFLLSLGQWAFPCP